MLLALAAVRTLKIRDGKEILCCVEKDAPELGDTTCHVFLALFWECAIDKKKYKPSILKINIYIYIYII